MRRAILLLLGVPFIVAVLMTAVTVVAHSRSFAGELAAETQIRSIHRAESEFHGRFGRYAKSLSELGLANATEGYTFLLKTTPQGYALTAWPKLWGSSGRRTFYSDETLTIRQNWSPR